MSNTRPLDAEPSKPLLARQPQKRNSLQRGTRKQIRISFLGQFDCLLITKLTVYVLKAGSQFDCDSRLLHRPLLYCTIKWPRLPFSALPQSCLFCSKGCSKTKWNDSLFQTKKGATTRILYQEKMPGVEKVVDCWVRNGPDRMQIVFVIWQDPCQSKAVFAVLINCSLFKRSFICLVD